MHSDFEERKYGGLSKNDVVSIVRLEVRHIDNLAQALFEEWHDFAPWSSVDKIRSFYHECFRDDNLPLAFAAIGHSHILLGSAALKRHDIAAFPQYEYWLGDVFVLSEHRGKGVGRYLVAHCIEAARSLGIRHLYLYTPDAQAFLSIIRLDSRQTAFLQWGMGNAYDVGCGEDIGKAVKCRLKGSDGIFYVL